MQRFKIKNHIGDVFFFSSFTLTPAGIIHKTDLEQYWVTDELLWTPYYGRVMARNRFQIIWRFLQFRDPDVVVDAEVRRDNLFKVRPVLDYLQNKFQSLFQPGQNIGIDEGMLKWRGRLHFRVYQKVFITIKHTVCTSKECYFCSVFVFFLCFVFTFVFLLLITAAADLQAYSAAPSATLRACRSAMAN